MTVVEAGKKCVSACAVIFMSALPRDRVFRYSGTSPGRFLHVNGELGFHAPELRFPDEVAASLSQTDAARMAEGSYAEALSSLREVAFPRAGNEIAWSEGASSPAASSDNAGIYPGSFVYQMSIPGTVTIPTELLLAFLTVPPHQVFYVTQIEEALNWGIELYGYTAPKALTEGMLASACVNVSAARCALSPENECTSRPAEMLEQVELIQKLAQELQQAVSECAGNNDPECAADRMKGQRIASLQRILKAAAAGTDARYESFELPFGVQTLALAKVAPAPAALLAELRSTYSFKKLALTEQRIFGVRPMQLAYGFEMTNKRTSRSVCHVHARWTPDYLAKDRDKYKLAELKIDTGVDGAQARRPLLQSKSGEDEIALYTLGAGYSGKYTLRPWRMLPAGSLLKNLDSPQAWSGLDEGENFFGIPAEYVRK
jgi:hypothetical protein